MTPSENEQAARAAVAITVATKTALRMGFVPDSVAGLLLATAVRMLVEEKKIPIEQARAEMIDLIRKWQQAKTN